MEKIIIGIDPGVNGGISWYDSAIDSTDCKKMPQTILDIYSTFADLKKQADDEGKSIHCYIEDVGRGISGQSSAATAKFARHMGNLEMALTATKIPFTFVIPSKWMKALSLGKSGDYPTKIAWKNHLKDKAQQQFPNIKITLWNADALLISLYGKLINK